MASLRTPTSTNAGQGIITALTVVTCVTGDTVFYGGPVRGWWTTNKTTADAISTTYSATTQLFTIVVANTPDIQLFIIS